MDHIRILKRAFSITLNYRALWVFGILLALTAGGGGNPGSSGSPGGAGGNNGGNGFPPGMPGPNFPDIPWNAVIGVVIAVICLLFLLGIVFTILRYIAETAAIRMVNEHERTGEKVGVRQGFRLGWTGASLRLFLIDLIFGLGGFIVFIVLLAISLAPLLLWATDNQTLGIIGTVITIGMVLLFIFVAILVSIALSLVKPFMFRAAVLEDRGVFEAIRRGFEMVRRRLGDVFIMGLILFALGIAWSIVMIPVFLLLVLAGAAIGGLPALLAYFLTTLVAQNAVPWIVAAVVGAPLFLLALSLPLLFLGALVEIFKSSTWTLTYREALALETAAPLAGVTTPAVAVEENRAAEDSRVAEDNWAVEEEESRRDEALRADEDTPPEDRDDTPRPPNPDVL